MLPQLHDRQFSLFRSDSDLRKENKRFRLRNGRFRIWPGVASGQKPQSDTRTHRDLAPKISWSRQKPDISERTTLQPSVSKDSVRDGDHSAARLEKREPYLKSC